jgi:16S rRNA (cytidine1402-2'-O)-methyltransferase
MSGVLYLIPSLLGPEGLPAAMPPQVLDTIRALTHFVAESAKSARQFLKQVGMPRPLAQLAIAELSEHTRTERIPELLVPLRGGHDVGLLSEAGCPSIADPGAELVAAAHREGLRVAPLVGPSSLLLALMGCGLNGQRFCFHGYLPVQRAAREQTIRQLESDSAARGATQLFIEAPYRNNQLLAALLATLRPTTRLCLAADLMQPTEAIATRTVQSWKANVPNLDRRPTVFLLLA